jgi:hypothetical protein
MERRYKKRACRKTSPGMIPIRPSSTDAVSKAYELNPLVQRGQPLLASENPAFGGHVRPDKVRLPLANIYRFCHIALALRTSQGSACIFIYTSLGEKSQQAESVCVDTSALCPGTEGLDGLRHGNRERRRVAQGGCYAFGGKFHFIRKRGVKG